MGSNPVYNLTWGEYGTSLISAVQLLRCHGELVDVTLAAGGRTFHAHKVVLCAASPFLLDLLKSTTCKHPVVMLAGVQAADLEALLEFVYRGEVSIDQNQLPSLLQAAHCLNIQGLAPSPPSSVQHELVQQQQVVKSTSDVPYLQKSEAIQTELTVLSPMGEEELPVKRKKRSRQLKSPPSPIHPDKVYIQSGNPNENVQDQSSVNAPVWAQQMNIINLAPSTEEPIPNQPPISIQNVVNPLNNNVSGSSSVTNTGGTKMKGASDQPGACPLCGAMLRQARNLRRHLVTSCKYRMLNGEQNSNPSTLHSNRELTLLQPVQATQTVGVVQENIEHLESKPVVLTPISCTELMPSNTNIISISSNTIQ